VTALLEVEDLHAHYDKSHILHGVHLTIGAGEIVSLLGRNGSGRSTTLKTIMGLVRPSAGAVRLDGVDLAGDRAFRIARAGLAYVPEEREIFANLSVDENMRIGMQAARPGAPAWTPDQMYGYFPHLRERRDTQAGMLSGGEQQMLTICRSLLGNPRVILIDEPTEGLAAKVIDDIARILMEMKGRISMIVVEQNLAIVSRMADRIYLMNEGNILHEITEEAKLRDPAYIESLL
jgi:branched-chain amino acid transport system ATP-binding protein